MTALSLPRVRAMLRELTPNMPPSYFARLHRTPDGIWYLDGRNEGDLGPGPCTDPVLVLPGDVTPYARQLLIAARVIENATLTCIQCRRPRSRKSFGEGRTPTTHDPICLRCRRANRRRGPV